MFLSRQLLLRFTITVSMLLAIDCQSKVKVFSIDEFTAWFLNPTEEVTAEYINTSGKIIDSFVISLRSKSPTGPHFEKIKDSSGISYLLGYYAPEKFRTDTLYPLVIYLHGGTGTELNTKGEKAYEMLRPLADSTQLFLASPSANRDARWWSADGLYRILQTVRYMSLYYPIDPDKIFLAGVSDGATACWEAANTICGPFAGFFAISGFGGMLPSIGVTLYPENIRQRPIYNVNAGRDRLYPYDIVNKFLDYMLSKGVPVTRNGYPEEEHGFDYREKEFPMLYTLIKVWQRPEDKQVVWFFTPGVPNLPPSIIDWSISEVADVRYVNGVLKDDTLAIHSQGISSITICLPAKTDHLNVKMNNKSLRKISPVNSSYLNLKSLVYRSNPVPKSNNFYKITF